MEEKLIYKDHVKWSDLIFSIVVMSILSFIMDLPLGNSLLLICVYPVLFIFLSKRYSFYETYFTQEGIIIKNRKKYYYTDILKCTIQNQIYTRKTLSFYFNRNKRINVHYSHDMADLRSVLERNDIKIYDKA